MGHCFFVFRGGILSQPSLLCLKAEIDIDAIGVGENFPLGFRRLGELFQEEV